MKKYLCLMLVVVLAITAVGCANTVAEAAVLPPSRIGEGTIQASFGDRYTFDSALSAADVVA